MPRKRSRPPRPPQMTWKKATPLLVVCGIFDALRFMFEWFIFFGPALATVYCTAKLGGTITSYSAGILGEKAAAALCGSSATVVAFVGAPAFEIFGLVMAMVVGFAGWLTLRIWILLRNGRLLTEVPSSTLWFLGSLFISSVPFLGSFPALTTATWRLYGAQIKKDKENVEKWEKRNADALAQEHQQQQAEREGQNQAVQQERAAQQEAKEAEEEDTAQAEQQEGGNEEQVMYRGTGAGGLHPKEGHVKEGYVTYVSPSKEFASERAAFLHKENATTHAVRVRVKNTFDYENEDHVARLTALLDSPASIEERFEEAMRLNPNANPTVMRDLLQQMAPGRNGMIRRGEWSAIESPRVKQALQKLGFDSFYVREVVDGKSYKNMGVFDASKVAPETQTSQGAAVKNKR